VNPLCVKAWEVIANNLSKAGWSWGCVSASDREIALVLVRLDHIASRVVGVNHSIM